jgi:hypothetical protein
MLRVNCFGVVAASMLASAAFAAPMNDSVNWEGQYNANAAPNVESGFVDDSAGGYTNVVGDGTVRLNNKSQNQAASLGWWYKDVPFDFTTGASMEARIKVNDPTAGANAQLLAIRSDTNHVVIRFFAEQIQLCTQGVWDFSQTVAVDTTQWHSYRVAVATGTDNLQLYIDDVAAPLENHTIGSGRFHPGNLFIGDITGDEACDWSFDYLRWTSQGAFAPAVPEPTCLAGAAVVMTMSLARRRTHKN